MHRIFTLTAAGVAALTLAACGSSSSTSSAATSPTGSASMAASTAAGDHVDADVVFAQEMIAHHGQAVDMADLALSRGSNVEVKKLASRIKAAQAPEITEMTGWLTSWGQPSVMPSSGPSMAGMDMSGDSVPGMMSDADMRVLGSATGTSFDRQFLTMMVSHHQGAITMAKSEQSAGRYGPAKSLAGNIITSQSAEITEMQGLLKTV